jgi:hypothetical protein
MSLPIVEWMLSTLQVHVPVLAADAIPSQALASRAQLCKEGRGAACMAIPAILLSD